MSWLTETDFRRGDAKSIGITINVPFLHEIKRDFDFRELLTMTYNKLNGRRNNEWPTPIVAANALNEVRDEIKTYFALEEFYGYFDDASIHNPRVGVLAESLRLEHEPLFLQLNELVELSMQIAYEEINAKYDVQLLFELFEAFCEDLAIHEQNEMDLMMQLCNEDIGVGD